MIDNEMDRDLCDIFDKIETNKYIKANAGRAEPDAKIPKSKKEEKKDEEC